MTNNTTELTKKISIIMVKIAMDNSHDKGISDTSVANLSMPN